MMLQNAALQCLFIANLQHSATKVLLIANKEQISPAFEAVDGVIDRYIVDSFQL